MIALLHTHVLVVVLFLLLYATKVVLLLLNKSQSLAWARKNTRVLDIIFGLLILITGAWLIISWNGPLPVYLIVKIILVLAAIPLGAVGLKRNNKVLAVLGLLIFAYVYGIAETDNVSLRTNPTAVREHIALATPETELAETRGPEEGALTAQEEIMAAIGESSLTNAKSIYVQLCAICHGEDGRKQLAGAPDLTRSSLSREHRVHIIENGRGMMPAYGKQLTKQETEVLAAYTLTLKTN